MYETFINMILKLKPSNTIQHYPTLSTSLTTTTRWSTLGVGGIPQPGAVSNDKERERKERGKREERERKERGKRERERERERRQNCTHHDDDHDDDNIGSRPVEKGENMGWIVFLQSWKNNFGRSKVDLSLLLSGHHRQNTLWHRYFKTVGQWTSQCFHRWCRRNLFANRRSIRNLPVQVYHIKYSRISDFLVKRDFIEYNEPAQKDYIKCDRKY